MNYLELLNSGIKTLSDAGIADARLDAWELLSYVCKIDKNYYYSHMDELVLDVQVEAYQELIDQRASHIPLQYLTGYAWFMGMKIKVNEHVLIPRFDTEILVEQVLKRMEGQEHMLDMCTGSGCIILALLHERPDATGVGADISKEAILLAKENAENLHIKADFIESDLFSHLDDKYDIIVSNPPYIPSKVIDSLDPEVKSHEPILALDGHEDGLYFYRKIIDEAVEYLTRGGYLCFEIGFDQGEAVSEYMKEKKYTDVTIIRDLSGLDRVVIGGKPCLTN